MKKMWLKTVVTVAVILAFVACGKNGGSSPSASPAKKEADTKAKPKLLLNTDNNPSKQNSTKEDTKKEEKSPKMTTSAPNSSRKGGSKDNLPNNGYSADSDVQRMLDEAKMYSGGASDYLRTLLEVVQDNARNPMAKTRNLKMANSIRSASLKIDHNATSDVALSLTIGSSEQNQQTGILGGTLGFSRETRLIGKVGKFLVTGDLKCMDEITADGPTCENSLVSLTINRANVKLIMRRTNVVLNAKFPNINCRSSECEEMYKLFRQTEVGVKDPNTVKAAKVESFEVIQGRSGFRLIILTNANQVITAGGPLLNSDFSPVTNVAADRTLRIEDLVDLRAMENYKTDLQSSLKDVRIVGNNGRGKITLQVRMKMLEGNVQDSFQLTLERIQRDVISTAQPLSAK